MDDCCKQKYEIVLKSSVNSEQISEIFGIPQYHGAAMISFSKILKSDIVFDCTKEDALKISKQLAEMNINHQLREKELIK